MVVSHAWKSDFTFYTIIKCSSFPPEMDYKKKLTREQALVKIRHYCAYQERCHAEVKEKLFGYGLYGSQVEELISTLIEEDYLNEERFAIMFAGGKFRMKQWGKKRIEHELKQKKISSYCINKALKQINDEAYVNTARKLIEQKREVLKGINNPEMNKKLRDYLVYKGYEFDLIQKLMYGETG